VASKEQKIVEKALKRAKTAQEYWNRIYQDGRDDLEFCMGAQWPDKVRSRREKDGRPCLTENRLLTFVHQVINDIRQSRPAIVVRPVDDKADVRVAKVLQGIVRNIESVSDADTCYNTAAWNAITAGVGWVRITKEYDGTDSFDQELKILRVLNFESVLLDPNSKEMDGSDAEYAFIYQDMPKDEFESLYPDADTESLFETKNDEWVSKDHVRIAEYFYKEYETKRIALTDDGVMLESDAKERGLQVYSTRDAKLPIIHWCKLNAFEILEKTKWDGVFIPIVPVYGEEVFLDGRRQFHSLIRQAKDAQRMLNFWKSASAEIIAYQPKAPFIALEGQIDNTNAQKWASANVETHAYLTYKPVQMDDGSTFVSAPQRQMPPQGSTAMIQEQLNAAEGIKATLGIFNSSLGATSNETSGKAILARQAEGDNATYHFVDNLSVSMRQIGRVLVDMIPTTYSNRKIMRIIGDDDEPTNVPVNQNVIVKGDKFLPVSSGEQGERLAMALNAGKYDVVCSIGASYATKRQESAAAMLELVTRLPDLARVAGDIIVKTMDFPDADKLAERIKLIMPPEARGDDPQQAIIQQAQQQIEALNMQIQQLDAALKDKSEMDAMEAQNKKAELMLKARQIEVDKEIKMAELSAQADAVRLGDGDEKEAMLRIVEAIRTLKEATFGIESMEDVLRIMNELQQVKGGLADVSQAVDIVLNNEEQKVGTETTEQLMARTLQQLTSAIDGLNRPKRIVTDAQGNIIGAEPVETLKKGRK